MVVDPRSHRIGGPADQWAEQGGDGHESYSQAVEELGAGIVSLGEENREHADLRHGEPGLDGGVGPPPRHSTERACSAGRSIAA